MDGSADYRKHSSSLVEANVLDSLSGSDLIFDPDLNIVFNANDAAVVKLGILDVRFSTSYIGSIIEKFPYTLEQVCSFAIFFCRELV